MESNKKEQQGYPMRRERSFHEHPSRSEAAGFAALRRERSFANPAPPFHVSGAASSAVPRRPPPQRPATDLRSPSLAVRKHLYANVTAKVDTGLGARRVSPASTSTSAPTSAPAPTLSCSKSSSATAPSAVPSKAPVDSQESSSSTSLSTDIFPSLPSGGSAVPSPPPAPLEPPEPTPSPATGPTAAPAPPAPPQRQRSFSEVLRAGPTAAASASRARAGPGTPTPSATGVPRPGAVTGRPPTAQRTGSRPGVGAATSGPTRKPQLPRPAASGAAVPSAASVPISASASGSTSTVAPAPTSAPAASAIDNSTQQPTVVSNAVILRRTHSHLVVTGRTTAGEEASSEKDKTVSAAVTSRPALGSRQRSFSEVVCASPPAATTAANRPALGTRQRSFSEVVGSSPPATARPALGTRQRTSSEVVGAAPPAATARPDLGTRQRTCSDIIKSSQPACATRPTLVPRQRSFSEVVTGGGAVAASGSVRGRGGGNVAGLKTRTMPSAPNRHGQEVGGAGSTEKQRPLVSAQADKVSQVIAKANAAATTASTAALAATAPEASPSGGGSTDSEPPVLLRAAEKVTAEQGVTATAETAATAAVASPSGGRTGGLQRTPLRSLPRQSAPPGRGFTGQLQRSASAIDAAAFSCSVPRGGLPARPRPGRGAPSAGPQRG